MVMASFYALQARRLLLRHRQYLLSPSCRSSSIEPGRHTIARRPAGASRGFPRFPPRKVSEPVNYACTRSSHSFSSSPQQTDCCDGSAQCWACGGDKADKRVLICPSCNAVQAPHPSMDYFQVLDQDQTYDLNLKNLEGKYKNLMKRLHPDLSHGKRVEEKEYMAELAALVTTAYNELLNPVSRATYLLRIKGVHVEEEGTVNDPELISEVMEMRETLEGQQDRPTLQRLFATAKTKMDEWSGAFSSAFADGNHAAAVSALQRMSYFDRIFRDIKRELI